MVSLGGAWKAAAMSKDRLQMNDFPMTFAGGLFAQLNGQKIQVFPESVHDFFLIVSRSDHVCDRRQRSNNGTDPT
jgi:hypothetical protein